MRTLEIIALALAAASPVGASVTYTVSMTSGGGYTGAFTYVAPTYVSRKQIVGYPPVGGPAYGEIIPLEALQSCSFMQDTTPRSCGSQQFTLGEDDYTPSGMPYDVLGFGGASGIYMYYFENEAFSRPGFYESLFSNPTSYALLTVSASETPEPASWAMMLVGFGLVGGVVRRRKVTVSFG